MATVGKLFMSISPHFMIFPVNNCSHIYLFAGEIPIAHF